MGLRLEVLWITHRLMAQERGSCSKKSQAFSLESSESAFSPLEVGIEAMTSSTRHYNAYRRARGFLLKNTFRLSFLCLMLLAITGATQGAGNQKIQQLDQTIQSYAFQRLAPLPKTGVFYNVSLPSSVNGVKVQAVRLRSGSLRRHGLVFNEFNIPVQSLVETTSKYVVLIYRDFSVYPTPPPDGFTLVAPVLGIKAFEGNDLTNSAPQEVNLFSGSSAITLRIPFLSRSPHSAPFCAFFDKQGIRLTNVSSSPNVCTLPQLVDSSLAVASVAPMPAPSPAEQAAPTPLASISPPRGSQASAGIAQRKKKSSKAWKLAVGITVGGVALLMLLTLLGYAAIRMRNKARIARMEYYADNSETLQTALIGTSRAPAAAGTRTRPVLENDYVPA